MLTLLMARPRRHCPIRARLGSGLWSASCLERAGGGPSYEYFVATRPSNATHGTIYPLKLCTRQVTVYTRPFDVGVVPSRSSLGPLPAYLASTPPDRRNDLQKGTSSLGLTRQALHIANGRHELPRAMFSPSRAIRTLLQLSRLREERLLQPLRCFDLLRLPPFRTPRAYLRDHGFSFRRTMAQKSFRAFFRTIEHCLRPPKYAQESWLSPGYPRYAVSTPRYGRGRLTRLSLRKGCSSEAYCDHSTRAIGACGSPTTRSPPGFT
ncbi:uncharacterized protein SCHCODRAFT_02377611 [Schizophyllum commune H4-8]|uniref:uncharacterized protein n=1 Tax=Schizophyllum commune (strain H4-8 / FGSC 9210) TaxID=578458 RepID=UPI00215FF151|nr:uncharacterized protein SCHCODRAFT_02377611 [Schizophyllum commune H4-8]KAI5889784.1 hypothetical protein SCHCODRAFT_02377611 [Schizophyllum commune H4-8]